MGLKFSICIIGQGFLLGAHFFTTGHDFAAVVALCSLPWSSSQDLWAVWLDRYRASLLLLSIDSTWTISLLKLMWTSSAVFYCSNYAVLVVCHFHNLGFCQSLQNFIASSCQGWLALMWCYLSRWRNCISGDTNAAAIILTTRIQLSDQKC